MLTCLFGAYLNHTIYSGRGLQRWMSFYSRQLNRGKAPLEKIFILFVLESKRITKHSCVRAAHFLELYKDSQSGFEVNLFSLVHKTDYGCQVIDSRRHLQSSIGSFLIPSGLALHKLARLESHLFL